MFDSLYINLINSIILFLLRSNFYFQTILFLIEYIPIEIYIFMVFVIQNDDDIVYRLYRAKQKLQLLQKQYDILYYYKVYLFYHI